MIPQRPCFPSPCGPNSQCREINGQAVCSCVPGFIGSPATCRPECIISAECNLNRACVNQKCIDPCPGTCGIEANCQVVNHNPICSCPPQYTGDPFIRCQIIRKFVKHLPTLYYISTFLELIEIIPQTNPCQPSPCGPNSECKVNGDSPACSCLSGFIGSPPSCRPECVSNSDCPESLACISRKCRDPCPGSCGSNAECHVISHTPNCNCLLGYTGDPFSQCVVRVQPSYEEPANPCMPTPCGANAICRAQNGAGACSCLPEYIGDPYSGCRPECVVNSDCPYNRACVRNKCVDPCPGTCGTNANCQVIDHSPSCVCRPGYTGDPFNYCSLIPPENLKPKPTNPCTPSPCGPNSNCRVIQEQAVCSCLPDFSGSPPSCRPECTVNSECPLSKACISQKCADPCPGTCGVSAICRVLNHSPICSCKEGYTGDPFSNCFLIPIITAVVLPVNPCIPNPCGPYSECRDIGGSPACSCLTSYIGNPPNCRPECVINSDCSSATACIREKCVDPCPGSCGISAVCDVVKHTPICSCPEGFTGDPFSNCLLRPIEKEPIPANPCNPSPCGPNTVCEDGVCRCLPEYQGDPYTGCRPECVLSTDCPRDKTCIRNRCMDPCPGTCGQNAECKVINHIPTCSCLEGFSGNAFVLCFKQGICSLIVV